MIPEPFTAVASSMGMLSVLVTAMISSAKNVYHIRAEWISCWSEILALEQQLQDCHERLESMAATWSVRSDDNIEAAYIFLLGKGGLTRIEQMLSVASAFEVHASESLRKYWKKPGGAGEGDQQQQHWSAFRTWLGAVDLEPGNVQARRRRTAMKAAFAMVTGDDDSRKIKLLVEQIDMLEAFLKRHFDDMPNIAPQLVEKKLDSRYLQAMVNLRDRSASVTDELSTLLRAAWECGILCSIVPRLKDREGHVTKFMDHGDLTVTLSLQPVDGRQPEYSTLSQLTLPLEAETTPADLLQKLLMNQAKAQHSMVPDQEAGCFEFSIREVNHMSAPSTSRFRSVVLRDRVQLALGLLNWASLVWDTPWICNLCVCSTQQTSTRTGEAIARVLPQLPHTKHRCSLCQAVDKVNSDVGLESRSGRDRRATRDEVLRNTQLMFRIGLTLCELALCTPVEVDYIPGQCPRYRYGDAVKTQVEMLRDVERVFRGHYANVAKELLMFVEDPSKTVAPFDVVCQVLERAREELQPWYEQVLCARSVRQSSQSWRKKLVEEHEQRMLHLQDNVRMERELKSTKGKCVQRLSEEGQSSDPKGEGQRPPAGPIQRQAETVRFASKGKARAVYPHEVVGLVV